MSTPRDISSSGLPLALGILGGIALAGSVHGALYDHPPAGSPARKNDAGGRFRRVPVPAGFTTSPLSFVHKRDLKHVVDPYERGRAEPGTGLFHVTTNLPAVLADRDSTHLLGRIRSRLDLRAIDRQGVGLGGGWGGDAAWVHKADRISVGLTLDNAQRVLRGMRLMARAVHGQIKPDAAMDEMLDLTADARDILDRFSGWIGDDDDPESPAATAVADYENELADDEKHVRRVIRHAKKMNMDPGHALYEALSGYEATLTRTIESWVSEDWIPGDEVTGVAPVGFTEPAERFARVRVEDLGLLQLAGRRGAPVEVVKIESELRFRPEDLRVVGVWEER